MQGRASLSLTQYSHPGNWDTAVDTANRTTRPSVCSSSARPFMPPRGRPTLVVLSPVASSSLSRRSSLPRYLRTATHADPLLSRLLPPLGATPPSPAAYFGPSSLLLYVLCGVSSFPRDSSFVSNYYTARTSTSTSRGRTAGAGWYRHDAALVRAARRIRHDTALVPAGEPHDVVCCSKLACAAAL